MAKLKALVAKIEDVDEKHRDLYTKTDAGYVLDVDDGDYKTKIGEFRGNNIELKQQLEKLQGDVDKFKGIDPKKYKDALAELTSFKEKNLIEAGKIDEVVHQRTEQMRSDLNGQITALTARAEKAEGLTKQFKGQLDSSLIETQITSAISGVGAVRKGAIADVIGRARALWVVNEQGQLVAMKGSEAVYGKSGDKPLTPTEWAQSLMQEAPFLFEPAQGGGAGGSKREGGSGDTKTIAAGDKKAFGDNLAAIAAGTVKVDMGGAAAA